MKKIKQIVCSLLLIVTAFSVFLKGDIVTNTPTINVGTSTSMGENNSGETQKEEKPANGTVNVTLDSAYSFLTKDREEWDSINPYFDEYERTENTSNFHSHSTAVYNDINGRTVTVDTLFRKYKEALNDPNFSMAALIYQCIRYKLANPEQDVDLAFTSFRVSPTAAACLNPNSPYYGYVHSLYTSDYDDNGFVRIVYLLVEAAKLGIDVTIVGHLNSYDVKQYNPSTGKTSYKAEPSYRKYFNDRMSYPCYEKYAKGDTVGDHMLFRPVDWVQSDKTATDVMHTKICAVSHYLDNNGREHEYGVWFSSTNLDANDYRGYNGNGGSQAGVIITGHEKIYNTAKNYVALTAQYNGKEGLFELRQKASALSTYQAELILAGREDEIPEDEQIIYLGTKNDKVFELYFTPLGGEYDTWDLVNNPYCKYVQELYDSTGYVVVSWSNPNFYETQHIPSTIMDVFRDKFITNKNVKNRLNIRCKDAVFEGFSALKVGTDIGFKNIKTSWQQVHEKDLLMSYELNGERKYVSILNSCNFHVGAMYYQTNQILVIKETAETGKVVYETMGELESQGAIKQTQGLSFSAEERRVMTEKLTSFPSTVEAVIQLQAQTGVKTYGNIISNNDFWNDSLTYRINASGNPEAVFGTRAVNKQGVRYYKEYKYAFDKINVCTGKKINLAIVADQEHKQLLCYVDGELKQTLENVTHLTGDYVSANAYVIGGEWLGSNAAYFKGKMYGISIFSDIRTPEEITADSKAVNLTDGELVASYNFTRTYNLYNGDSSKNRNHLRTEKLWLDETEIAPAKEDEYCFAVVGDTQVLSWYHPEEIATIYDWLLENKETRNIKYVMGVGDITEESKDYEWSNAAQQIGKLSGEIPYSIVMGNHDKYDQKASNYAPTDRSKFLFNQTFYKQAYLQELDGWYGEGDVSCSYNAFEVGETKWLVVNLDFGPTDEMLAWASNVIQAHADHKVIIVTHAYLYRNGTTLDKTECYPASETNAQFNDGDEIWDKLVSKHENIQLVLSGHDPWDHIVCAQDKGDNGNTVTQLLIDGQYMDKYYQPTAMVALLYFSADGEEMTVRYYSTAKQCYGSELSQFTVKLG